MYFFRILTRHFAFSNIFTLKFNQIKISTKNKISCLFRKFIKFYWHLFCFRRMIQLSNNSTANRRPPLPKQRRPNFFVFHRYNKYLTNCVFIIFKGSKCVFFGFVGKNITDHIKNNKLFIGNHVYFWIKYKSIQKDAYISFQKIIIINWLCT